MKELLFILVLVGGLLVIGGCAPSYVEEVSNQPIILEEPQEKNDVVVDDTIAPPAFPEE